MVDILGLGIIILSLDFLTRPKPMKRDKTTQKCN